METNQEEPEKIVELTLGFTPEASISNPMFYQTENKTILTFNTDIRQRKGSEKFYDQESGIVEIHNCLMTRFGAPSDDIREEGRYYAECSYGIYEVLNSSWWRQAKVFYDTRLGENYLLGKVARHFIFRFRESIFECIADEVQGSTTWEPVNQVVERLMSD